MSDEHRLDRAATQRVLRQASTADGARLDALAPYDDAGRFDAETVVAAAVDAGIAETEVRRALAVERLGDAPAPARGDALLGPAAVVVDAEVTGTPGEVLAMLDGWFVSGHHLRRDRLRGGHGVWSRRHGALGAMFRTVRRALGEGGLGELERIEAAAADTGSGTSAVRVIAHRRRERLVRGAVGATTAATGTAVIATIAAVTQPVVLLAVPLAVGVGAGLAATGRRAAGELTAEVERVLDAVDHGDPPARLGPDIVRRVVGPLSAGRAAGAPRPDDASDRRRR